MKCVDLCSYLEAARENGHPEVEAYLQSIRPGGSASEARAQLSDHVEERSLDVEALLMQVKI
jgi:hypothetical protein